MPFHACSGPAQPHRRLWTAGPTCSGLSSGVFGSLGMEGHGEERERIEVSLWDVAIPLDAEVEIVVGGSLWGSRSRAPQTRLASR
jgi:hypothetical protein